MSPTPKITPPPRAALLAVALVTAPFVSALPTVTNLGGDLLAYQENQDQNVAPALVDVGGNAIVSMTFAAGVSKFQFQFTAGSTPSEDLLSFGNYGTGAGQIVVGWTENGSGTWGNFAKVGGVVVGTWDTSTGTITFNSAATNDTVTTLIRNLRYTNSAQFTPTTATRTVRLSFTDATNQTLSVNTSITVTAVDDAPEFMGAGCSALDFNTANGGAAYGRAVAQQSDGKYVAVYDVWDKDWNNHLAVVRFNPDGMLDSAFGTGGIYNSPLLVSDSSSYAMKGLVIRTDVGQAGKIVVSTSDSDSILLFQLNPDGTLDTAFGSSGVCRFDAGTEGSGEEVSAIAQQTDGKLLAIGAFYDSTSHNKSITLWRFKADGSGLDTTFASPSGYARSTISDSYSYGYDLLVQPDGKIVAGGLVFGTNHQTDAFDLGIRRYNSDGSLDTSFGAAGMAQLDYADTHEGSTRIARQNRGANAGKIIVVGDYSIKLSATTTTTDLIAARLNADGSLDTSFGTAGWTTLDIVAGKDDHPTSVCVDANDNIVITTGLMYNSPPAVVRLTPDGALDASFNGNGKLTLTSIGSSAMLPGGIIDSGNQLVLIGGFDDFELNPLTSWANGFPFLARLHPDGSADTMGNSPFIPGGAPVVIDPDIQIFDGELATANYAGSNLTLQRHGGANAADIFGTTGTLSLTGSNFVVGGTTIGTFTNASGTLTVTFNSAATTALLRTAFRQITYRNSSATPPPAVQLDWLFSDGNTGTQGSGGAQTALGVTVVDIAIPRIYAISPTVGPGAGGTAVAVNGRYFITGATARFGANPVPSITVDSPVSLTATSPTGAAGTVHVVIATSRGSSPEGTADQFTYTVTSYTDWAASNFSAAELADPTISGAYADPDGAGLANLVRYAFDLPARGPASVATITTFDGSTTPATITLSFTPRAQADDILYSIEASEDLMNWSRRAAYQTLMGPAELPITLDVPAGAKRYFLRVEVLTDW